MNRFVHFLILIFFMLYACKSTKINGERTNEKETMKIIHNLEKKQIEYQSMDAKARVYIKNEDVNQNISIDLKIAPDSLIWASAKLFGLEVARVFVDNDKITIIDKINSKYYLYPLTFIKDNFAIPYTSLKNLEALLTGSLLFVPNQDYQMKADSFSLIFENTLNSVRERLIVTFPELDIEGYQLDYPQSNQRAEIRYREKIKHNRIEIPKIVEIWAYLPDENYIKLNYFSIRFNEAIEFDTSIPSGYLQAD